MPCRQDAIRLGARLGPPLKNGAVSGVSSTELDSHPKAEALAHVVRTALLSAADEQRTRFGDGLSELLSDADLQVSDGDIGGINVLEALDTATETPHALPGDAADLLQRLLLKGVALGDDERSNERTASAICWLAAHTAIDPLTGLDDALGVEAEALWSALATRCKDGSVARGERLVAATALAGSDSSAARAACVSLREQVADPLVLAALQTVEASSSLAGGASPSVAPAEVVEPKVSGELMPNPSGPVALFLQAVTGVLLLRYVIRLIGRILLRARRPAELVVSRAGVTVSSHLEVLGRTVRSSKLHIPTDNLARASIEVRYPRIAMYIGLIMLALGTFVGASLVAEGLSVGSTYFILWGAAVFGVGVALDMILASLWPSRTGDKRMIFVPRKGRRFTVGTRDEQAATDALRALQQ